MLNSLVNVHSRCIFFHPQEEEQSIQAEEEGVVQVPLEGYKYVILHLLSFKTTFKLHILIGKCWNYYLASFSAEEYPSSTSQTKCQKALLEILGMQTAETFEEE